MPEIAEVFRAADYIRQHLVGRTLASVKALHDENVFGKVGTSAAEIEKATIGKKIVGAGSQGKYFWITLASPPHLLCHFGMNGWFHIKGIPTFYYKDTKKDKVADKDWPPRHWKILFETKPEGKDKNVLEAAFVDSRRFSRVRLIDCPADDIRKYSPLKENGPDPNTDKDIVTRDWLSALCGRKKAPIKAMLLDQGNISGIGNWVGDEILYQARIHPEQYSNTLSDKQVGELYKQMMEVVRIAIETKSDSDQFPKTWLFKHRWGKGRKAVYEMPNGDEITYVTVGGRTSAIVPSLQKKTGPVAGDVDEDEAAEIDPIPAKKSNKRKKPQRDEDLDNNVDAAGDSPKPSKRSRRSIGKPAAEASGQNPKTKITPKQSTRKVGQDKTAKMNEKIEEDGPDPSDSERLEPQAPHNKRLKGGGYLIDTIPMEERKQWLIDAGYSEEHTDDIIKKMARLSETSKARYAAVESRKGKKPGSTSKVAKTNGAKTSSTTKSKKVKTEEGSTRDDSGRRRSGRLSDK